MSQVEEKWRVFCARYASLLQLIAEHFSGFWIGLKKVWRVYEGQCYIPSRGRVQDLAPSQERGSQTVPPERVSVGLQFSPRGPGTKAYNRGVQTEPRQQRSMGVQTSPSAPRWRERSRSGTRRASRSLVTRRATV